MKSYILRIDLVMSRTILLYSGICAFFCGFDQMNWTTGVWADITFVSCSVLNQLSYCFQFRLLRWTCLSRHFNCSIKMWMYSDYVLDAECVVLPRYLNFSRTDELWVGRWGIEISVWCICVLCASERLNEHSSIIMAIIVHCSVHNK
jgi:hypothetical protein